MQATGLTEGVVVFVKVLVGVGVWVGEVWERAVELMRNSEKRRSKTRKSILVKRGIFIWANFLIGP